MTRKILYITGTRADYGLMRSVLHKIHVHPELSLDIVITGMHLMDEFGNTVHEIQQDGFKYHIVDAKYEHDTKDAMVTFIGVCIQRLIPVVSELRPDIILVLGDRAEMFAAAIAGVYLTIPVAHIHGGEVTSTTDDLVRHAITKLAHIHFPPTERSKERILMMGEEHSRIFVVGAPGLDQILDEPLEPRDELEKKFQLDFSQPVLLVIQHPVSLQVDSAKQQMRETMEAVKELQYQTIVIYPNADAGGRAMIDIIREYDNYPFIKIFKSIQHREYISLLREVRVLVGNSSSGIIEAPSFGLPVVNIGNRQRGREQADNVINVGHHKEDIKNGIVKALFDTAFLAQVRKCKNPYGVGKASEKIVEILARIEITDDLLQKTVK